MLDLKGYGHLLLDGTWMTIGAGLVSLAVAILLGLAGAAGREEPLPGGAPRPAAADVALRHPGPRQCLARAAQGDLADVGRRARRADPEILRRRRRHQALPRVLRDCRADLSAAHHHLDAAVDATRAVRQSRRAPGRLAMDFDPVIENLPRLLNGFVLTLELSAISLVCG